MVWGAASRNVVVDSTMGALAYWLDHPDFSLLKLPLFPWLDVVHLIQTATTMRLNNPGITTQIRNNVFCSFMGWMILNSMCMILTNVVTGEKPIVFDDNQLYAKVVVWLMILNPPYDLVFAFSSTKAAQALCSSIVSLKIVRKVGLGMTIAQATFPGSLVAQLVLGAIGGATGPMVYALEVYIRTGQWARRALHWGSGLRTTCFCMALFIMQQSDWNQGYLTRDEVTMIGVVLVIAHEYTAMFVGINGLEATEIRVTGWMQTFVAYTNPSVLYQKISGGANTGGAKTTRAAASKKKKQ